MPARKNSILLIAAVLAALAFGAMAQEANAQVYYYAPAPVYVAPAPVVYSTPVYLAPAPVIYTAPVYYYPTYCYRPSGFGFAFGYWGGHRYYHHSRGFGFSFGYSGCR
ncbi:MAG: virulence factor [Phycisphaerae bacterium]